jgi:hypothetical protein
LDYHLSRRWTLFPLLVAAGLVATAAGVWLYTGDINSPPNTVTTPWFWWLPFGWFIFIPVFFLIFFGVR